MESAGSASNSRAKGNSPAGDSPGKKLRGDGAGARAELQNSAAVPMLPAMELADEPEKAALRGKDKERNAYKVLSLELFVTLSSKNGCGSPWAKSHSAWSAMRRGNPVKVPPLLSCASGAGNPHPTAHLLKPALQTVLLNRAAPLLYS
ncbi:UNVERIFIED_CONTAM: hypothetical protein K2H54_073433 [Gekko kuhli]